MTQDGKAAHTTEGEHSVAHGEKRMRLMPRERVAGLWKGAGAIVALVGTVISTLFVLVDHGFIGGDRAHEVFNVAARDMTAEAIQLP